MCVNKHYWVQYLGNQLFENINSFLNEKIAYCVEITYIKNKIELNYKRKLSIYEDSKL